LQHDGQGEIPELAAIAGLSSAIPDYADRVDSMLVVSPNSRNSFIFEFAKAAVHKNGPSLTGFTVKYDYTLGKGYR
jgi:hypothetical protein